MLITQYGYENPSIGDLSKGATGWMAQINFDISRIDQHSHNGIDSALLSASSISPYTLVVAASAWSTNGGGVGLPSTGFVQTLTVPTGITEINNYLLKFLISTAGIVYVFATTAITANAGDTYTNNGSTFTVLLSVSNSSVLYCSSTGSPSASGVLTRNVGTGTVSVSFSSNSVVGLQYWPMDLFYQRVSPTTFNLYSDVVCDVLCVFK